MSDPTTPTVLPTRDGYDRWSEVYDADGNPLIFLEEPHVDALLGTVTGLKVLDVGCGTGRHALRLAAAGAVVTAVDFSEGMLAKAREKAGAEKVSFVRHDLAERLPFDNGTFDRVLCGLVIDHIEDLARLFGDMGRVCKARPGGNIVISSMHPAMMLRGVQARFRDPKSGEEVRPRSVPNQISDYVMAAVRSGLSIEHMSEHIADAELARRAPRAEKHVGWPLLLMMGLSRG